jgi:hypothetical protein
MTHYRTGLIVMTAGVLLFSGSAFAQHFGFQGHFAGPPPPSMHGSAHLTFAPPYPRIHSGYARSFPLRRGSGTRRFGFRQAFPPAPAGAPANQALSSSAYAGDQSASGYALALNAASYCATPRGACHLAERQIVGDKCWCVGPTGQYAGGMAQ